METTNESCRVNSSRIEPSFTEIPFSTDFFMPIHDAYTEYGNGYNQSIIRVEQGKREGFLQFDLSSVVGTISAAELQITIDGDSGYGNVDIHLGSHSDWTESNLSGSTKPSAGTIVGSFDGTHSIGQMKTISLDASQLTTGALSLILIQKDGNDFAFAASEHTTASIRPKLILTIDNSGGGTTGGGTVDHEPIVSLHDAYLQGSGGTRYNNDMIRIEHGNRVGYLQFDLSAINGEITSVQLELTIYSDNGYGLVDIYKGSHNNWTENNLSNNTKPTLGTKLGSMDGTHALNEVKNISLTASQIATGELTLIVQQADGNDFAFASSEHTTVSMRPKLWVTTGSSGGDTGGNGGSGSTLYGSYQLINGTTNEVVRSLDANNVLTVQEASDMNIRAIPPNTSTKSVHLTTLNRDQTENMAPYALYGDNAGDYYGETMTTGGWIVTIKYYSEPNLGGSLLNTDILNITVEDDNSSNGDNGDDGGDNGNDEPVSKLVFVFDTAGNQMTRKPEASSAKQAIGKKAEAVEEEHYVVYGVEHYQASEEETLQNGITIFPNPSRGRITMQWNVRHNETIQNIVVSDMLNRRIPVSWQQGSKEARVDLTGYAPGVYLVHFYLTDGSSVQKKIIKK